MPFASLILLVHVVVAGDTLGGIAQQYDTTVWEIAAENGIENVDLIHVGQHLRIPEPAQGGGPQSDVYQKWFPEQPDKARRVVMCESTENPRAVNPIGYYGMWQFDLATWRSVGGTGYPHHATADEQTMRARMLYDSRGWQPWPVCGKL